MGLGLITCGKEGLVGGVHTLVGGVVQVYHRLQVQKEEEKERKVEQEEEKEDQGEETAHMDDYGDAVKGANRLSLSHGACVCEDEDTTRLPEKVRTTLSGCVQWSAHRAVPRKHGCRHWCPCHGVPRKHTCCHWRPYRAVLRTY